MSVASLLTTIGSFSNLRDVLSTLEVNNFLSKINPAYRIAIDLGTDTSAIFAENELGMFSIEDKQTGVTTRTELVPTLIIYDPKNANVRLESDDHEAGVIAVGSDAYHQWGRTLEVKVEQAMKDGNIGYQKSFRAILRHLVKIRYPSFQFRFRAWQRATIYIGVPKNSNTAHQDAIRKVIKHDLKANPVLVWEQVAALVGAKVDGNPLPLDEPGSIVLADIGGGSLDFAIYSGGLIAHLHSFETAGNELTDAVENYLKAQHELKVSRPTAIEVKEKLGSALPKTGFSDEELECYDTELHRVYGSSTTTSQPTTVLINRREIRECLQPVLDEICDDFNKYMRMTHDLPGVHGDIKQGCIYLTGRSALLDGLDRYISNKTGLPIRRLDDQGKTVLKGLVIMMKDKKALKLGLVEE